MKCSDLTCLSLTYDIKITKAKVTKRKQLEKMAVVKRCSLKSAGHRASRSGLFFWPNLYCACPETATSELSVQILTSPIESATPISYK